MDVYARRPAGTGDADRGVAVGRPDRCKAAAAGRDLAFLRRSAAGVHIHVNCLRLGTARILYLPGELFVEYQLAAQQLRPDLFVAMAAYGEYAPGYIGTEASYTQGGYETGRVSRVGPAVEAVLTKVLTGLLRQTD